MLNVNIKANYYSRILVSKRGALIFAFSYYLIFNILLSMQ